MPKYLLWAFASRFSPRRGIEVEDADALDDVDDDVLLVEDDVVELTREDVDDVEDAFEDELLFDEELDEGVEETVADDGVPEKLYEYITRIEVGATDLH